jgi:Domain of unknown function (DUF1707)
MRAGDLGFEENGAMSMSGDSGQRIGNAEREVAISALNQHWQAGRLDPAEHERRTTAAYAAVTQGDLDALFADLPRGTQPHDPPRPLHGEVVSAPSTQIEPQRGTGVFPPDSWVARHRDALMGLTPFVALVCFFVFKSWLWFLLIPAAGVILYSGDDRRKRRRDDTG